MYTHDMIEMLDVEIPHGGVGREDRTSVGYITGWNTKK